MTPSPGAEGARTPEEWAITYVGKKHSSVTLAGLFRAAMKQAWEEGACAMFDACPESPDVQPFNPYLKAPSDAE